MLWDLPDPSCRNRNKNCSDGILFPFVRSLSAASKKAMKCPGGQGAWHNVTLKDSTLVCQDQVDACFSGENGECALLKPGLKIPAGLVVHDH